MIFSYSLRKQIWFPIVAMQFLIIHSVLSLNITNDYLSHKCFLNQGKYNSGSGYEDILNILFGRVRTGDYDITGFRYTSKKTSPLDSASVMLQCRGDSYGSKCRTCADIAVTGFLKRCPKNKGGIIWYEQCFLYVTAFGDSIRIKTNYKNIFSMYNPNNVRGDGKLFAKRTVDFFSELTLKVEKSAKYNRVIFYAAGEKKLGKNTLYAMVQCVELTLDCKTCLAWSITKIFMNSDIKQGGRVFGMNCEIRYELYPFFRS
ncbi:putative cysteine-rich repeat secretory protein 35 [Raphanus sativus]|uniref:Cysteine-rich repeat secretory protein 35 n=1 Tax=Raphanus sativus TaxID=3726 RepID=A0A6J0P0P5_RAPSA|nr:putative cysteine-rich repeat secretory protein 35 [Raphanus sativus]